MAVNNTFLMAGSRWNENSQNLEDFDVTAIQAHLKKQGIPLIAEANENSSGPVHITLADRMATIF